MHENSSQSCCCNFSANFTQANKLAIICYAIIALLLADQFLEAQLIELVSVFVFVSVRYLQLYVLLYIYIFFVSFRFVLAFIYNARGDYIYGLTGLQSRLSIDRL